MTTPQKLPSSKWLLLVSAFVFMGQQAQSPASSTTRTVGPGFAVLEQAKQLRAEKKYREAATRAIEAGQAFQQNGDWASQASCYEEAFFCAVELGSTAFYQELIPQFSAAVNQMAALNSVPARAQLTIRVRLSNLHHLLGAYEEAADAYEKSFPFAEQLADSVALSKLYSNAASVIWLLGDDYRALLYHEKALELIETQGDKRLLAAINTNLGNAWRTIDASKAAAFYEKALTLDPDNSETLMLLSKAFEEGEKNYDKALEAGQASLQLARSDVEKADALHQLGRVFFALGQYDRALHYYRKSLPYAVEGYGVGHPEFAKIHVFIGSALLKKGEYEPALAAYNRAMSAILPLFVPRDIHQNPASADLSANSLWVLEALLGKARTYEQMSSGQLGATTIALDRSLACAETALAYLHKIKLTYGYDRSKYAMSDYVKSSCSAALRSATALYRLTGSREYAVRAFHLSEQNKAVVLAEALYKRAVKGIAGVPEVLLEQEKKCHEQVAFFEKKLADERDGFWKDSLFYARRQLEVLEKELTEKHPEYGAALFGYRASIAPDSVMQQLPADAALLEYFWADSVLYTFLLTKDTFWIDEQALPGHFLSDLAAFRRCAGDWQFASDSSATASQVFLKTGRQLYACLLEKPLTIAQQPRLFIVPDGPLNYLPFELLPTKGYRGRWIDREVPFLLKEKSISYRFSCKTTPARRPTDGWGGFGLEYDDNTLSAIEGPEAQSAYGLRGTGKLPFADDEILAVAGLLNGACWLNERATRSNFLQNAGKYGILHLAMHGFVDNRDPLRSRLLFSKSAADDDPFVYASDLYNLQLSAGLAVLSACQSGTGSWQHGEGVMSLARAFAFAGCPSLVMSLWNVSDRPSAELMVAFYRHLEAGKTKDEALRAAKLEYLQSTTSEYAKPVYWAGFVPVGDMEAMPASCFSGSRWSWAWQAAGILAILSILWAVFRRFRR